MSTLALANDFGSTAPLVLVGYLLVLIGLGYYGWKRGSTSEEDYYLSGRGQGWWISSLTIMATFFSGFALLGAPGLVYKEGLVFALFAINVPVAGMTVFLVGSRVSRIGRARGHITPADTFADYYDSPVALRLLTSLVGMLFVIPYVIIQVQAGGLLSQVLFPDVPNAFERGAVGLAIVTVLYICAGGMRGVALTDALQGLLLIGGMVLSGVAAIAVIGGVGEFSREVSELPAASLTPPGTTGGWTVLKLYTVCLLAPIGSMLQPAQWIRFNAARSVSTLRRSGLIVGTVLPIGLLFGSLAVGLGGQVLYPFFDEAGTYLRNEAGALIPHPDVGTGPRDFDSVLVVILRDHLPELFGAVGLALGSLIVVAIMASSMSTADSNLHALGALFTRDFYARFISRNAGEKERAWVGRGAIVVATALALTLILVSRSSEHFNPIALLAQMGLLAIAFSCQVLPATIDVFFLRRGTRAGAFWGMAAGVAAVFLFTPFPGMLGASDSALNLFGQIRKLVDLGAVGLIPNVAVFVLVSLFTQKPDPKKVAEYAEVVR